MQHRIVKTCNFDKDYPNESFVLGHMTKKEAEAIADVVKTMSWQVHLKCKMNKQNLLIGAKWLLENIEDKQFDMLELSSGATRTFEPKSICGEVACALGWMPMCFGVVEQDYVIKWVDTFSYSLFCERVFRLNGAKWDFCFSSLWAAKDNTLLGAAQRMYTTAYGLEEGEYKEITLEQITAT